ncbi:MAG: menaquinone biosynthesis protein [Desulfobacula sp.]|nr:menaquinone biosynthesis protein [Desulfobacula sp.]MBT3807663.1 menaquinone biosynthesis protein [Desulfobacula sp.]MBT5546867.1 menaquinone biosynthesis protein [Desulfobacula sp.]MBT7793989.1 menaquinone biosynthesis protein [Desulfobacula sp.]
MGKISYINDAPVYFGLDHGLLPPWLKMVSDVPSVLNGHIKTGEIKISPVSAAFYAMNYKDLLLLPDLSISCNGRVMSVILASNYGIDDMDGKKVIFSHESASAAAFLKMIFHQKKVTPIFEVGPVNNYQQIFNSADAALVIGDTALLHPWAQTFEYCIDLGQLWYEMTKLPFVFAVWVVRRSFAEKYPSRVKDIHKLLLTSKDQGYQNIDKVIEAGKNKLGLERSVIKEYFDLLYCDFDDKKVQAMGLFFDSLLDQGILNERADIEFFI